LTRPAASPRAKSNSTRWRGEDLSLSKLDLTGSGTIVLESIATRVAKVSWNSFQPEVDATGWTDNSRSKHIEVHQSGNWGGTWIAVGPAQSKP
jgi:hypothetical protein